MNFNFSRKGVVAPVFSYLFVILAGGIILLFFIWFAMQQVKTSDKMTITEVSLALEQSLNTFGTSVNSYKPIDLGVDTEVEFGCESISVGKFSRDIQQIIFSSGKLKSSDLLIWTQAWKFPFRVGNFFYIADKNTKFVLVYDSKSKDFVDNLDIPEIFKVIKVDRDGFKSVLGKINPNEEIRVGFFTDPISFGNIKNVKWVQIGIDDHKVKFMGGGESGWIEEQMVYGALFSPDHKTYECLKNKALDQLSNIADIYTTKANYLKTKKECEYSGLVVLLTRFKNAETVTNLYSIKDKLISVNNQVGRGECDELF